LHSVYDRSPPEAIWRNQVYELGHRRSPQTPARVAVDVLNELGGVAELKLEPDGFVIGYRCPLADVIPQHPAACRLAETLLAKTSGLEVTERCTRNADHLECRFEVRPAPGSH
jgi:predicted ArsR family transcriptional regulator